jgi:hypothetical protein
MSALFYIANRSPNSTDELAGYALPGAYWFNLTTNTYYINNGSQMNPIWASIGSPPSPGGTLTPQTLTDQATITWDVADGINAIVTIAATGRTVANPTNIQAGETYTLSVKQDATGSRTITTWGSYFDFGSGGTPVLSTAANAVDLIIAYAYSATKLLCSVAQGFDGA